MQLFVLFSKSEQGGSLGEYALICALIALACVSAIATLGTSINTAFSSITGKI